MRGAAIRLDHQPLLAEHEVALEALYVGVDLGPGQVFAVDQRQEQLLELGAGSGAACVVNGKHRGQEARALATLPGSQLGHVEVQVFRLVDCPLERPPLPDYVSEVDHGASRRGDDDAVAANALAHERRLVHDQPRARLRFGAVT
jgi:hypothetical protein